MGALDQPAFEAVIAAGCTACGSKTLEIRSFIDRTVGVMFGDATNAGRWAHDGEKFVDGTYRIECVACKHVAFASDICPRCNGADRLTRALADTRRQAETKRSPSNKEKE